MPPGFLPIYVSASLPSDTGVVLSVDVPRGRRREKLGARCDIRWYQLRARAPIDGFAFFFFFFVGDTAFTTSRPPK